MCDGRFLTHDVQVHNWGPMSELLQEQNEDRTFHISMHCSPPIQISAGAMLQPNS